MGSLSLLWPRHLPSFLAFRTNAAYGRWWEARQLWGQLVNTSRALAVQFLTMLDDETEDTHRIPLRNTLVLHHITFTHALRCHLRRQTALPEVETFLGKSVARELSVYKNLPAGLVLRMGSLLRQARNEGMLDSFRWAAINENLTALTNVQGASRAHQKSRRCPVSLTICLAFSSMHSAGCCL